MLCVGVNTLYIIISTVARRPLPHPQLFRYGSCSGGRRHRSIARQLYDMAGGVLLKRAGKAAASRAAPKPKATPRGTKRSAESIAAANSASEARKAKANNTSLDLTQRETLDLIVSFLTENPHLIFSTFSHLHTGHIANETADTPADDVWVDSKSYWRNIPKYWLAQVAVEIAQGRPGGSKVTLELMDDMDAENTEQMRLLIQCWFGVNKDSKFPRELLPKTLMQLFLQRRGEALGHRYTKFVQSGAIGESKKIDWRTYGAYSFEWGEDNTVKRIGLNMKSGVLWASVSGGGGECGQSMVCRLSHLS